MSLRLPLWYAALIAAFVLAFTPGAAATVTTTFAAGTLTITGDGDDDYIAVGCAGGEVTVNGTPIAGPVLCADVETLIVDAGAGDDQVYLDGVGAGPFSTLVGPIEIDGAAGNDDLNGSPLDDAILGGDGVDFLQGGPGGNDSLDGQGGGDTSYLNIDSAVTQSVAVSDTGADPNVSDQAQASGSPVADTVTVTNGSFAAGSQTMSFTGIETISVYGETGDDTLNAAATTTGVWMEGGPGNDALTGGAGDDFLGDGGAGDDTIDGGAGQDQLNSFGAGTDTLDGEAGGDNYNVNFGSAMTVTIADTGAASPPPPCPGCWSPDDDHLSGNGTSAGETITMTDTQLTLGAGTINHSGIEQLNAAGRGGDDTLNAAAVTIARVSLVGEGGNDTLTGGASHDQLNGDSWPFAFCDDGPCPIPPVPGDDTLVGGAGNDNLATYGGTDALDGQGGDDSYTAALAAIVGEWTVNPANGHYYGRTSTGGGVADAEQQAVDWGGHLATIDNAAEEAWIRTELGSFGLIGLNDIAVEGTMVWTSGDPVVYTNFCGGEPNDLAPGEDAVEINRSPSEDCWNDVPDFGGDGIMELNSAPAAPAGNPTINDSGAGGHDTLSALGTSAADTIVVSNTQVTMGATTLSFTGIEQTGASGAEGDDTINASGATIPVSLRGQVGNDTLTGGSASDSLEGDDFFFGCPFCPPPPPPGNDTMTGNGGSDTMNGNGGNDFYDGGMGSDWSQIQLGLPGSSTVTDSGPPPPLPPPCPPSCGPPPPGDNDQLNAEGTPGADLVLATGSSYAIPGLGAVTYNASIEWAIANGQDGDDTLDGTGATTTVRFHGNAGNDTLIGGDGDDWLKADDFFGPGCGGCPPEPPPGNDTTSGGGGNDYLFARGGTDTLDGQDGSDRIELRAGPAGSATVGDSGPGTDDDELGFFGSPGPDAIAIGVSTGSVGTQTAAFSGIEVITGQGEEGDDTLNAAAATATVWLNGGGGNDMLTGGAGADSLNGDGCCMGVPGNDVLNGGAGGDNLWGDEGDDTLDGGTGGDWMDGGNGTDTVTYATRTLSVKVTIGSFGPSNDGQTGEGDNVQVSVENVIGGSNADNLTGSSGGNTLTGGAGNDNLDGGFGPDTLIGGLGADSAIYNTRTVAVTVSLAGGPDGEGGGAEGDDVQGDVERIQGGSGNDTLTGNELANVLYGNGGNDSISGGLANDTILGGAGNDTMFGDDANDSLDGGAGSDVFNGGAGTDTATYAARSASVAVTVGAGANDGAAGEADNVGADIEYVQGGSAADTLTGGAGAEYLYGNAGADVLNGGAGNDWLFGGAGVDTLSGGNDSDYVDGGTEADTMEGDAGTDVAYYQGRTAAQPVDVSLDGLANDGGSGENDLVGNTIERVYGGAGNDTITGNASANALYGNAGNDVLNALGGNDSLFGGAGLDLLDGGDGTDSLDGGTESDTVIGGTGADTVSYATRTATQHVVVTLGGGAGNGEAGENDTIAADVERATGGKGNDTITGDALANVLSGGDGNDTITGGGGIDTISGQNGDDTMESQGDAAVDTVSCGLGADGGNADIADNVNADCEAVVET